MGLSFLSIIIIIECITSVLSQNCKYGTLDLSILRNSTIYCEQGNNRYQLIFTPCRNDIGCEGQVMIGQFANNNGPCMYNVATFNQSLQPTYITQQQSYIFEYKNGRASPDAACNNGRIINVTFVCEQNAIPYDKAKTKCDDEADGPDGICPYYFEVYTAAACTTPKQIF
eukprot:UN10625